MKTFIAANQKGGVGKTTTNCTFSHFLADLNNRTLIINGDEQEDTNDAMADYAIPGIRTHQLFEATPLKLPEVFKKLTLIASDRESMRAVEQSEVDDIELVMNLRARLAELDAHFDYAVFDTAGANSRVANAFLIESDFVTIPTKIDEHSIRESVETMGRVGGIKSHPDPRIRNEQISFLGLLVNEYDPRQPYQVQHLHKLQSEFGHLMVPYAVTDRQAYREAISARVPVWRLKAESTGQIKTSARDAGKEICAVFTYFKKNMDE